MSNEMPTVEELVKSVIDSLIYETRETLDRIEYYSSEDIMDRFKPSDSARLRSVVKRLTGKVELLALCYSDRQQFIKAVMAEGREVLK